MTKKQSSSKIRIYTLSIVLFVVTGFLLFHSCCWTPDGVTTSCLEVSETLAPWIGIITAFVLGLFGTFIALRQTKISYHAVRLDLYDRRYKIFVETRTFIEYLLQGEIGKRADLEKIGRFQLAILEAGFLFDSEVGGRLEEFRLSAYDLEFLTNATTSDSTEAEVRTTAIEKRLGLIKWLLEEQKKLSELFMPYLHFSKDDLS